MSGIVAKTHSFVVTGPVPINRILESKIRWLSQWKWMIQAPLPRGAA